MFELKHTPPTLLSLALTVIITELSHCAAVLSPCMQTFRCFLRHSTCRSIASQGCLTVHRLSVATHSRASGRQLPSQRRHAHSHSPRRDPPRTCCVALRCRRFLSHRLSTGRGSYGSVYKARVRATGAAVAVKVIPAGAPEEVAAIQREIEMLKQCNHPNVVRYLARSGL